MKIGNNPFNPTSWQFVTTISTVILNLTSVTHATALDTLNAREENEGHPGFWLATTDPMVKISANPIILASKQIQREERCFYEPNTPRKPNARGLQRFCGKTFAAALDALSECPNRKWYFTMPDDPALVAKRYSNWQQY